MQVDELLAMTEHYEPNNVASDPRTGHVRVTVVRQLDNMMEPAIPVDALPDEAFSFIQLECLVQQ